MTYHQVVEEVGSSDFSKQIKARQKPKFLILSLVLLGIFCLSVSAFLYFQNHQAVAPTPTPEPLVMASPVPTASPTPTPQINYSVYKIAVKNGSGKSGEAGAAKALLEAAHFQNITTANASRFDYDYTVLETKETLPSAVLDQLEKALNQTYALKKEVLEAQSPYDIVVIIGVKEAI